MNPEKNKWMRNRIKRMSKRMALIWFFFVNHFALFKHYFVILIQMNKQDLVKSEAKTSKQYKGGSRKMYGCGWGDILNYIF